MIRVSFDLTQEGFIVIQKEDDYCGNLQREIWVTENNGLWQKVEALTRQAPGARRGQEDQRGQSQKSED